MAYNYVPRLSSEGLLTLPYYNAPPNPFTPLRVHKNCTTYAYGRWLEIAGGDVSKLSGLLYSRKPSNGTWDGGAWYACSTPAVQAGKGPPQLGDICCWSIGDTWQGHVAVVEELHTDYVVMSQSEYHGVLFHITQNYAKNDYMGKWYKDRGYKLRGFLRMQGVPSSPLPPNFNMPTEWVVRVGEGKYLSEDEELNNAVMGYVAMMNADPTLTLEACCGILGNMYGEVTLNPGCLQVNRPTAGGLVGWDPLSKWSHEATLRGIPWTDGDAQCEWVLSDKYWSLSGGDWTLYTGFWAPSYAGGMTYDEFKHSTATPEALARLFCLAYEKAGMPHMEKRTEAARRYYDYLMGLNLPFWNFPVNQPYKDGLSVWQLAGRPKYKLIL